MSKKERIIIVLLASINFTHILDFMIMMPLGNYLMPYFDINPKQFSFLVGAYTFTAAAAGFTAAFFVDKFDRKKVLIFGYIGFLAGTFACGFAASYHLLMAARILAGLFGGLIGAQVMSIIADLFVYERRGAAMGAVMSSFAIASTLGVPFSLYLSNIFTWHAPFLLVGFLGLVIVPLVIKFIPAIVDHVKEKEEGRHRFHAILSVINNREQRLALLFSGLVMMGHFLIIPFMNPYLEFNLGFSKDQTPLVYLFGGMASFIAAIALGRLSDKAGKFTVFSYSIFFSLIIVVVITQLWVLPFSLIILLFVFWFIVATGRAVTAQAMISQVVKSGQRGSFLSFNSSVQQLGTALASLVAGFIVTQNSKGQLHHYERVGYLSVGVLLLGFFLGRFLFGDLDKKSKRTRG